MKSFITLVIHRKPTASTIVTVLRIPLDEKCRLVFTSYSDGDCRINLDGVEVACIDFDPKRFKEMYAIPISEAIASNVPKTFRIFESGG